MQAAELQSQVGSYKAYTEVCVQEMRRLSMLAGEPFQLPAVPLHLEARPFSHDIWYTVATFLTRLENEDVSDRLSSEGSQLQCSAGLLKAFWLPNEAGLFQAGYHDAAIIVLSTVLLVRLSVTLRAHLFFEMSCRKHRWRSRYRQHTMGHLIWGCSSSWQLRAGCQVGMLMCFVTP